MSDDPTAALVMAAFEMATWIDAWRAEGKLAARDLDGMASLSARVDAATEELKRAAREAAGAGDRDRSARLDSLYWMASGLARRLAGRGAPGLPAARVLLIARATFAGARDVYVAPDIPPHKIHGAEKKYLAGLGRDEELVALIDLTVFGRATDGVALLDRRFVHRNLDRPTSIDYAELPGMPITVDGRHLLVGHARLDLVGSERASLLARFLQSIAEAMGSAP